MNSLLVETMVINDKPVIQRGLIIIGNNDLMGAKSMLHKLLMSNDDIGLVVMDDNDFAQSEFPQPLLEARNRINIDDLLRVTKLEASYSLDLHEKPCYMTSKYIPSNGNKNKRRRK